MWGLKRGRKESLRGIYEKYVDELLTLATSLTGDSTAAEDIVQNAFAALIKAIPNLRLNGNLKGYLTTSVVNQVRDGFRRKQRQRTIRLDDVELELTSEIKPEDLVQRKELLHRLVSELAELPQEQREVVLLRIRGQMKLREIARLQEVSVKTVTSRYRYGVEKLRSKIIEKENETAK